MHVRTTPARILGIPQRDYAPVVDNRIRSEARILASTVNGAFYDFTSGRIGIHTLLDHIHNFIVHANSDWGVTEFLGIIEPLLSNRTFHTTSVKFSTNLQRVWKAYRDAAFPASVPTPAPTPLYQLAATKPNIEKAFEAFNAGVQYSDIDLHLMLTKHCRHHIKSRLHGVPEIESTREDAVQAAVMEIVKKLETFTGTGEEFYGLLRRICHFKYVDALDGNLREEKTRAPFHVTDEKHEDGYVEEYEIENPALQGTIKYRRGGKILYQQPQPQFQRELPEFIQGIDLWICQYIRSGHNYDKIGQILEIGENAVELRIRRMREKVMAMKGDASFLLCSVE